MLAQRKYLKSHYCHDREYTKPGQRARDQSLRMFHRMGGERANRMKQGVSKETEGVMG